MKKIIWNIVIALLVLLSLIFTVLYGNTYLQTKYTDYLCLALFFMIETFLLTASLILYRKGKRNRTATVIFLLSGLFCIPIIVAAMVCTLYFIGFEFLPTPK